MACPYLTTYNILDEKRKWYCELKEDYVMYERYKKHCYCGWSGDYLSCPTYKNEDEQRDRDGYGRLKRN